MSREIKFKVWDKKHNKMVNVNSIEFRDLIEGRTGVTVFCQDKKNYYWLDKGEFELLQYTGLNDKKGKEIYEGDILEFFWGEREFGNILSAGYDHKDATKMTDSVIFKDGIFLLYNKEVDNYALLRRHYEHCEVIGNIYDNPELLEEK